MDVLRNRLVAAKTSVDLRNIASREDFRSETKKLSQEDLEELRAQYAMLADQLRNRVQASDLQKIPLRITRIQAVDTEYGPTYYLGGIRLDDHKPFECWMPGSGPTEKLPNGGPIYRLLNRITPGEAVELIWWKEQHPDNPKWSIWKCQKYRENVQQSFVPF